jgi:UDP-GlcNAc3NAcA epimerase
MHFHPYFLATIHRPYNTDSSALEGILTAFIQIAKRDYIPVHPRTRAGLDRACTALGVNLSGTNMRLTDPDGYLDMLQLERNASAIFTDSGGVQRES